MFRNYISKLNNFKKIISNPYQVVKNSNDYSNLALLLSLYENSDNSIIVLLPDMYKTQIYYDNLISLLGDDKVLLYPADELITAEMFISSMEFKIERLNTIYKSLTNEKFIVITNLTSFIKFQFNKTIWQNAIIKLNKNIKFEPKELNNILIKYGYKRVYTVEKPGEFSIRGSIIDYYSILEEEPVRLDFFGNEIDEIKIFDLKSQKSIKKINEVNIYPITELFYDDNELKDVINKIKNDNIEIEEEDLINRNNIDYYSKYINYFKDDNQVIADFFDAKLVLVDEYNVISTYNRVIKDLNEISYYNNYYLNIEKYLNKLENKYLNIEGLTFIQTSNYTDLRIKSIDRFEGNFNALINFIKENYQMKKIILCITDTSKVEIIKRALYDYDIFLKDSNDYIFKKGIINIVNENYFSFEIIDEEIIIINEDFIFKNTKLKRKIRYKSLMNEGLKLSSIEDLKIGDYVVHYDYGIGRYKGLITMTLSNITRDYIHLEYKDNDKLYIPIEKFDLIRKYQGSENTIPMLTKLGGKQWEKTKARIKEKTNDISEQLIKLYALRKSSIGHKFQEDTVFQKELEDDFEFEETEDQIRIINEVKKDMESTKPMDRLICGDVGYGKTEIALRAAFKAIMEDKQVAYLAPTTILSRQHYLTFKSRLERFGINVELLNRFVNTSKAKKIIEDLKKGLVDVIIGTHRILSNDIVFKDLGLLIIDEEQRFGVQSKERIKELKVNVDTITLSATPIPRTLQMSLIGIKDLSLLETPPKNRYPIQTYVIPRNDYIIKEAIEKELARSGQVFYLYNRVDNIEEVCDHIKRIVPYANVTFAHGRMDRNMIENIIDQFINNKFNVLVCTTIIETGIDIPNTNTLIIHDANKLGLSQLYQIRGRVGRSDKIAYAYLMYEKSSNLSTKAVERLKVIKEFTELGSGFKIAMRDLNIRGAGDILGSEQSGFIDSVGLDVYMQILNETIKEKQGLKSSNNKEELTSVLLDRTIKKEYIDNDDVRIEVHKKIDKLKTSKDINELKEELVDRFGDLDKKLELYMYEKVFINICNEIGIEDIFNSNIEIRITFNKEKTNELDASFLFEEASKISRHFNFKYEHRKIKISLDKIREEEWIKVFVKYLELIK